MNQAMIGNITVESNYEFVVYGPVRGKISEHRRLSSAEKALAKDRHGCKKAGGYSDCSIYRYDDAAGRWFPIS